MYTYNQIINTTSSNINWLFEIILQWWTCMHKFQFGGLGVEQATFLCYCSCLPTGWNWKL
jgi:hypothetical protein